ncbi:PE domain-containing protein [Gordonia sp. (in: high G+C Gram-positive bacteria)]|uniref:PE domain-containing protein n=1 Tax=Gordonia sp. (in: high G+C Gram-positive bacteria) TaxID=84139 RepID=UPI0039E38221
MTAGYPGVKADPRALERAAAALDDLAAGLRSAVDGRAGRMAAAPVGRDEVSVAVAEASSRAVAALRSDVDAGAVEIAAAARALRAQAAALTAADVGEMPT